MSNDTIDSRIELLQEQIESIERSGHFTEKEIDSKAAPLRMELSTLKMQQSTSELIDAHEKYGMTLESYQEGLKAFIKCFSQMPKLPKKITDIEVVDAEILTPNTING